MNETTRKQTAEEALRAARRVRLAAYRVDLAAGDETAAPMIRACEALLRDPADNPLAEQLEEGEEGDGR